MLYPAHGSVQLIKYIYIINNINDGLVQSAVLQHQRSDGEKWAATGRGRARRGVSRAGLRHRWGRAYTGMALVLYYYNRRKVVYCYRKASFCPNYYKYWKKQPLSFWPSLHNKTVVLFILYFVIEKCFLKSISYLNKEKNKFEICFVYWTELVS